MDGLGNQMFQYAFGKALEHNTGKKVLFDKSWYQMAKTKIINDKGENSEGVVMRGYALDIFNNIDISFAKKKQIKYAKRKNYIVDKFHTIYDEELLNDVGSGYYQGYFQHEKYFKNIKNDILNTFIFPKIQESDKFNQEWLKKIKETKNSVFIHIRRGDYSNIGWSLPISYYKNAVEYIKQNVENPKFFVICQNCKNYVENEFNIGINFEFIEETNSINHEDWKDFVLMKECKHAIIANSTFSWWAAWLGISNSEGIVIAPAQWIRGNRDELICENWVKL